MSELIELRDQLRRFTEERDWGQFHDPKNLSMALAAEAGELLEVFQWLTPEEARGIEEQPDEVSRAAEEVADIMIYVVRLADVLGIDIEAAVKRKIRLNTERYPVDLARGNATKYDRR